jgi:hypothetical protein
MITRVRWIADTLENEGAPSFEKPPDSNLPKKEKTNEFNVRYIKEKLPF